VFEAELTFIPHIGMARTTGLFGTEHIVARPRSSVQAPASLSGLAGYNLVDSTNLLSDRASLQEISMESIGLFEAKTHLSELVARAERGEEVIITRHNKPVARIVPMGNAAVFAPSRRRAALRALQDFEPIDVAPVSLDDLISTGRT
jgi:prevent-host-death family protein